MSNIVNLPVIPLRGLVIFPGMNLHFDVGRKKSKLALKHSMNENQLVFLVCQKDANTDNPTNDDLNQIGVIGRIKQMIRIPNTKNLRVVVEGIERGQILKIENDKNFLFAQIQKFESEIILDDKNEVSAYVDILKKEFKLYTSNGEKSPIEVNTKISSIDEPGELADFVCSNSFFDIAEKQKILNIINPIERLKETVVLIKNENSKIELENQIAQKVQINIDKNQREYYLREELKVISEELGDEVNPVDEAQQYKEEISKIVNISEDVREKLNIECGKLAKMPYGSHEATVVRNYLDKCLQIPFDNQTIDEIDIERARDILNRDHYGLDDVKERIIESLAVMKRNPSYNGQILCLYGPPGVGKTSIVRALAESMGRKYQRIALGGVSDESEIRGHRKTYIGSMPGRIIDALIKSKVNNPIILLDEIDKLSRDYKGDPSSALLEALDPEQNFSFNDHFIDFPVDLSNVLFITTANDISTISPPLFDRMEVIELNSYTTEEKFQIAKNHLIKRQMKKHKLTTREFSITDKAIYTIIEEYTKESGVRNLKKTISSLCRKATLLLETSSKKVYVSNKNIYDLLGPSKYSIEVINQENEVGTVNGLAWTSVGGTMLPIEVSVIKGSGKIELTGSLGDVMKESAITAVSYLKSKTIEYGINEDVFKTSDIHIHAPEAAIPKDGPSAGLAITTAILSELTGIPIKRDVAMTGEISLKGKALPIGGLKEKSMAAYRSGCKTVIIPNDNLKDLSKISEDVKKSIRFVDVKEFTQVIPYALTDNPIQNLGE